MTDQHDEITVRIDVAPFRRARTEREMVVYGHPLGQGSLLFVPEESAHYLVKIHRVLNAAATWGELKAGLAAGDYETAFRFRRNAETDDFGEPLEPDPEAAFSPDSLAYYEDSYWPPNPVVDQRSWMPPAVAALGEYHGDSMIGPDWISFRAEQEVEVAAALRAHGYAVRQDEDLCTAAMGPDAG